jgi:hypothetical protein
MTSSGSKAAAGAGAAEAEAEADADAAGAAADDDDDADDAAGAGSDDFSGVKNENIMLFINIYKYFNISTYYRNQCKLQKLS